MKFDSETPAGAPESQPLDDAMAGPQQQHPKAKPKPSTNKCGQCRARLGLLTFDCRCGKTFCSSHRYADEHNCSFDYRKLGQEEIQRNNPQVIGEKIYKI